MLKHSKVVRIALVMTMATVLLALAACGSQQSSSSSSAASGSAGSASASSAAASSSSVETAGSEGVVSIRLDYNAGTGYEWKCTMEPEGVLTLVDQSTEDLSGNKEMTGGPLQEVFTFRAARPGEVALKFDLVRSWEGEPSETQVYAFTVANDLSMVLNPYKSDFNNEPEWGSNS